MTDQTTIISDSSCKQHQQQQITQQQHSHHQQQQQYDHRVEGYRIASINGAHKDEKGYTVVPASVSFRGVSMKLDLKIDQKTLAAATNFSKAVEEAVSTHLSSSVIPVENDEVGSSQISHIPPTSSTTSGIQSFSSSSSVNTVEAANNTNNTKGSPVICDSSVESTGLSCKKELCEQVNEVCSSTVDASPFCDTACSPIQLETQTRLPHNVLCNGVKSPEGTLKTLTEQRKNPLHSSVKGELINLVASTPVSDNAYLTPCASTSSAEVDIAVFSPLVAKKRKEKPITSSHLCEQIDSDKGQCRQRAIVNYKYCIRHILLDPGAPYIQCQHRRKPKSKKDTNLFCTNAIRKDKGTIYCSTHLIMNGLMEPKKKKAKTGAVIVESTELTTSNSIAWNQSVTPRKSATTATTSKTVMTTCKEIRGTSRSVEQAPARNDHIVRSNILNNAVIGVNSVTSKRTVYHLSKAPIANNTLCGGRSTVTVAPTSKNGVASGSDGDIRIQNTYPGPPKLSAHKIGIPVSISSSYDGGRSVYECPAQPTTSHIVHQNIRHSYPLTTAQVVAPVVVETRDVAQISVPQTIADQPISVNLTKQHPQLAAKLLQAPATGQRVAPSLPGPILRTSFAKSILPTSLLIPETRNLLPSAAPSLTSEQEVPCFYRIPDNHRVKSDVKQEGKDLTQKPKVIKLKQKRRRLKMTGFYRDIPVVDQMCRVLEDQDFDRTDLFPRGLEPSDDEDEENECLDLRWSELACNVVSDHLNQGPLQVYLVKKQIRLDKNALMKEAVTNAPIMHACKLYPASVGAALSDRASKHRNVRSVSNVSKRCYFTNVKGTSPPVQCANQCLPFSNHCMQHISYNLNQQLFNYCAEPCCSQPVLFVDAIKTSKLCIKHYEERKRAEKIAQENAHQSWNQQMSICQHRVQQRTLQYDEDVRMNMQQSQHLLQNAGVDRVNSVSIGDFGEFDIGSSSSGNESDVYLASFAKDLELGLDGKEINDMLANFNVADGDSTDGLQEQTFTDGVKDDFLHLPSEFNDVTGGHDWLDVEQFLISEGVDLSSSSQPNINSVSPYPSTFVNDVMAFNEYSSSSSSFVHHR
ncbi:unnamed protein product [Thelazia callipaeda]|uniref:KAT8 regulatory NSL complex subunit 2 n=1 Tax=Thelazia callipaeda TaxID=103827 RepID=A0A0N5D5M6_THECL|nr:unnamed protein product [Thelazia callipaeda]